MEESREEEMGGRDRGERERLKFFMALHKQMTAYISGVWLLFGYLSISLHEPWSSEGPAVPVMHGNPKPISTPTQGFLVGFGSPHCYVLLSPLTRFFPLLLSSQFPPGSWLLVSHFCRMWFTRNHFDTVGFAGNWVWKFLGHSHGTSRLASSLV